MALIRFKPYRFPDYVVVFVQIDVLEKHAASIFRVKKFGFPLTLIYLLVLSEFISPASPLKQSTDERKLGIVK